MVTISNLGEKQTQKMRLTKTAAAAVSERTTAERRTLLQIIREHRLQVVRFVGRRVAVICCSAAAVSAQPALRDEAICLREHGVITCRHVVVQNEHRLSTPTHHKRHHQYCWN